MRKAAVAVGVERRTLVGTTEFTVAGLLSGKATRVHLKQTPPPGVSGAYVPASDAILLFPVLEGVESLSVAAEEAGHSLHREDYLEHARAMARYINDCNRAGLPKARLWLDWLEDWRVFLNLLKTYPGAAGMFTRMWTFKLRNAQENLAYGKKTHDLAQEIVSSVCEEIASGYLEGRQAPKSYTHVLKLARAYLNAAKKTLQNAPQPPQKGKEGGEDSEDGDAQQGEEEKDSADEGEGEEGDSLADTEEEGGSHPGGRGAGLGPKDTEEEKAPPPLIVGVMLASPTEESSWVNAEPSQVRRLYAGRWKTLDSQNIDLRQEGN